MDRADEHAQGVLPTRRGAVPWPVAGTMRVLPILPLELMTRSVMRAILAQNPTMLSRLGEHANARFAIDPVDCPFAFLLEPRREKPQLQVLREISAASWDARISGNMVVLLGLLEGAYDGDALFFSRDLTIEGDTAAVMALRNAIEDCELDPGRLMGLPAGIAGPASRQLANLATGLRTLLGAPAATSERHTAIY